MLQIAKLTYEGGVIHEIGHGLGLPHHSVGVAKYIDPQGVEHSILNATPLSDNFSKDDKDRVLSELGVHSCAMHCNFRRDEEFFSGSLLKTRTDRYCHKNDTYVDDYKNVQRADNCYGKISVK
jgi:hypothetical protein